MKNLVILGSTGSVGVSALRVADHLAEEVRVVGLAARANADLLLRQASEFRVPVLALSDAAAARDLERRAGSGVRVLPGPDGIVELASMAEADIVLCAIVGLDGLLPSLAALRQGKRLAVASKEILVAAGELVMATAHCAGAELIPVDSEHSAVFQCLEGRRRDSVRRIVLTASGGPFRGMSPDRLRSVTVEQALNHPRWDMGRKITVDSATLMNKGLEIIEARWLFDMPIDRVDVVVHPESIVHSMVEFVDNTVLAQLSAPDMRFPIQYALTYPNRAPSDLAPTSFPDLGSLTFEPPDAAAFPALDLARRAGAAGGTMPAALSAANDVAVAGFLEGRIAFPGIWETVKTVLDRHRARDAGDLGSILKADAWARKEADSCMC